MNRLLALPLVLWFGGCAADVADPYGAQVLMPVDVDFSWNEAYNGHADGLVAVIPLDLMVYDGASGEPLYAEIELGSAGARFLDPLVVGAGGSDCVDCAWDAVRDEYVEFPPHAAGATITVETDGDGLARTYAVIDSMSRGEGGGFDPVQVSVALGEQREFVELVPR
jgi:hypothetical protein